MWTFELKSRRQALYFPHSLLTYIQNVNIKPFCKTVEKLLAWLPKEPVMETMQKIFKTAGHGKFWCIIDCSEVFVENKKKTWLPTCYLVVICFSILLASHDIRYDISLYQSLHRVVVYNNNQHLYQDDK